VCARADRTSRRDGDIVERLGAWYDAHARDLPWRRTSDPYSIWVSEVMLQQTRVETVIPYYRRFLERWADVRALAAAPLDDVLSAWAGLGYYRRARIMHATAREVTEHHDGRFPTEHAALRELGGIGEYTAGAVASIAGGERAALVDGNVARVLARVEGIAHDPKSSAGKKHLWAAAWRLVPADRPGRFNQALMELGARVCTPQAPRCTQCPLRGPCVAERDGLTATLPVASPKRARPRVSLWAAVIRRGQRTLLMRRDPHGKSALFAGLWEPPMVEADGVEAAVAALRALGVVADTCLEHRGHVRHVLTHRELEVTVAVARAKRGASVSPPAGGIYDRAEWVEPGKGAHALSTLARKILAAAERAQSRA
jgi:A/G-specific adenine glycosylase